MRVHRRKAQATAALLVKDNGLGIPATFLPHVLAVDDDADTRDLMKAILERSSADATIVSSGQEAHFKVCLNKQSAHKFEEPLGLFNVMERGGGLMLNYSFRETPRTNRRNRVGPNRFS